MSREIMDLPPPAADLRLAFGPHPLQVADLRLPSTPPPHPVVVMVHGGFWRARRDRAYMGHLCAALSGAGFATWNIEYRRLGHENGGWPGTFEDVALATDHLPVVAPLYELDLGRLIAMGHSAGGHLALWLAARHRIPAGAPLHAADPLPLRGAVSLAGVVDLCTGATLEMGEPDEHIVERFLGGTPESVPERYAMGSPFELLPLGLPQVLIHGTADEDVPYLLSERYAAIAAQLGDPAHLVTLPDMDHFAPVDPRSPAWQHVLEATRSLLG